MASLSLNDAPGADDEGLEAERWDLEPRPASLCSTSTHADERMDDTKIRTTIGVHAMPFEKRFKILGHFHSGWKDAGQHGGKDAECEQGPVERCEAASKDVPWRVKCRRMGEQVYCVFCYGSENWCWSGGILDRFKGCERNKGYQACVQTLPGYCTRTALAPRTIWQKMKLRFWSEMIAARMWRAMGWTCDTRPEAVWTTQKYVCAWRCTGVVGKHKGKEHDS